MPSVAGRASLQPVGAPVARKEAINGRKVALALRHPTSIEEVIMLREILPQGLREQRYVSPARRLSRARQPRWIEVALGQTEHGIAHSSR